MLCCSSFIFMLVVFLGVEYIWLQKVFFYTGEQDSSPCIIFTGMTGEPICIYHHMLCEPMEPDNSVNLLKEHLRRS